MAEPASTRSAPPDRIPYVWPATSKDVALFRKPSIDPKGVPKSQERTKGPPLPSRTSGKKRKRNVESEKNYCLTQGE
jgi:hypothetical protein